MKTYHIKNIWKTLQGEGFFAGRPAVFVRMTACNMWSGYEKDRLRDAERHGADCPRWCDTDFTKEGSRTLTAEAVVKEMKHIGDDIRFCVLTGGEPFLQADAELMQVFHASDYQIAVETNGTISLAEAFGEENHPDWIVCSPKLPESHLTLEYCHELKLVVPDYLPENYANFAQNVRLQMLAEREQRLLWLQPEDGPHYEQAKQLAIETALAHPEWRVSTQTHKVLGVE